MEKRAVASADVPLSAPQVGEALRRRDLQPSTLHLARADWARGRSLPWPRPPRRNEPRAGEGSGRPAVATPTARDLGSPGAPWADLPGPYVAAGLFLFARVGFITCTEEPAPEKGAGSSYRAFQSEGYFLIVLVADFAFTQTSTPLFRSTFGAMARYLPGLPLVFFE